MKKYVFTLGICLSLLQVAKPAQAQTIAKAQTAAVEEQAQTEQPQADKPKNVTSEKSILKAKADDSGYEKGDFLLSPKLSVASLGLSVDGEVSLNEMFAVGAYVGYGTETYGWIGYGYSDYRRNMVGFGGKFVFHGTGVFNRGFGWNIPQKLDLFATGYLGARIFSYTNGYGDYYNGNTLSITPGVTIGARYFFSPNVGVFAETGYNTFGSASVGISFKL